MIFSLNENKIPSILKECFLYYSYAINNCIIIKGEKQYKFNYTENSSLYNFANFIKENKAHYLNIDWLFEYFNYQFTHWNFFKEKKEESGASCLVQLHWILGKKALKRFNEKTSKDSYFYHSSFFPKFKIKKDDLINVLESKNLIEVKEEYEEDNKVIQNKLNKNEEQYKKIKYNTLEGFNLCINFTTLFRFDSELCQKCKYKKSCKKILKKNYPRMYQKRIVQNFAKNQRNNGKD